MKTLDEQETPQAFSRGKPQRHIRVGRWLSGVSLAGYILLWFLLSSDGLQVFSDFKFPSPTTVLQAAQDISFGTLWTNTADTFLRVVQGMSLGAVIGVGLGLLMAFSRIAYFILDPIIEAWRPVPAIAFVPFLLLWFGLSPVGKTVLVAIGVAMILVVSTVEATRNVPPIYLQASRSLGASRAAAFRSVVIPRIIPELIGPLRVSLALSFTLVVAAEFMGAQSGLGYLLMNAQRQLDTGVMFLAVFLFGVIAGLLDQLLRRAGARLTRWSERTSS